MTTEVYSPSRFIWKIDNFSTRKTHSHVFMVAGFKWKAKVSCSVSFKAIGIPYDCFAVFLTPANSTKFPSYEVAISVAITSQTNSNNTIRIDSKKTFTNEFLDLWHTFRLSEILDSSKGYIVNNSCVIKFEISRSVNKDSMDSDVKESDPEDCSVSTMQNIQKDCKSNLDIEEHHGHLFEEGRLNNFKGGFCECVEFEDIGGFSISKTQASLYKQIWAKYGHIPSTKVIPISSYSVLVMAVKDLMSSVIEMHQCRFMELSTEMIGVWEEKIKMAEKLEFNISWLREHFETVKKGVCGMQAFKTELLEHGQPLRAAKLKMKAAENELKKAEVQLIAAKDCVRKNASALLSDSDMEMYLEIGENLLFDGLFRNYD